MAVIFPNSPTLNQEVVGDNNVVYVWDGQKWKSANNVGPSLFGISSGIPPSGASNGDAWFDTESGRAYVYYITSGTAQWIDMSPTWNGTLPSGSVYPSTLSSGGPSWTASGDFSVDTDTLYVDAVNDRVGVGTASPSSKLHLSAASGTLQMQISNGGNSTYIGHDSAYTGFDIAAGGGIRFRYHNGAAYATAAVIDTSGRFGIGTTAATSLLHLYGTNPELYIQPDSASGASQISFRNSANNSTRGYIQYSFANEALSFRVNAVERMKINSSGHVTKPNHPSFAAWNVGGNLFNNNIVLNTILHNNGNHYDPSTGLFTAPVTGAYYFSLDGFTQNNSSGSNNIEIRKNNVTFVRTFTSEAVNTYRPFSISAVIYLYATETVGIFSSVDLHANNNPVFAGFLIG